MDRLSSRIMALAVAVGVIVAGFGAGVAVAAYTRNDTAAHKSSAAITNSECITCHGQKANETSLDPFTFSAHKKHLKSAFLRFLPATNGCGECHESTDLDQGSGGTVNKQVDVAFCRTCHGDFTKSKHSGTDYAATSPRGCLISGCHIVGGAEDPTAAHAAAGYVNTFFAASRTYCVKCHGKLKFYKLEETN